MSRPWIDKPMIRPRLMTALLATLLMLLLPPVLPGQDEPPAKHGPPPALLAVASNFAGPARTLADVYTQRTGATIELTLGTTGKHYAQIVNGAPFDAFLSADEERPRLLEEQGHAIAGTRFTYAVGVLVLWSRDPAMVDEGGGLPAPEAYRHLAIAKPELAPYGLAAKQTLEKLGLWQSTQERLVFGENISQAYHFVETGNAELGFVAWSQVKQPGGEVRGSCWIVPADLHTPIRQDAVLLKENETARGFLEYLKTDEARRMIADFGYSSAPLPGENESK